MFFKVKKANDQVIYLHFVPKNCNKWHIVFDKNGVFVEVRCFSLRKRPMCNNCRLVKTIQKKYPKKILSRYKKEMMRRNKNEKV